MSDTDPGWAWLAAIITTVSFLVCLLIRQLVVALVGARAAHCHTISHIPGCAASYSGVDMKRMTLFFLGAVTSSAQEAPNAWSEFAMGVAGLATSGVLGASVLSIV